MAIEEKTKDAPQSLGRRLQSLFHNSFIPAVSGMTLIILALICFIIAMWAVMAIVRLVAGLTA